MTAQGEDILAWLDRAITVTENTARKAAEAVGGASWDGWDREVSVALPAGDTIADGVMYGDLYEPMKKEACEHMGLHDPESVLRRCAADRKAVTLYAETVAIRDRSAVSIQAAQDRGVRPDPCVLDDWSRANREAAYMLPLIQILAEGYGWTGDER